MDDIYKIQIPIESNVSSPPALIYNQDRSVEVQVPVDSFLKTVMGGEKKKFVFARLAPDGSFIIKSEAPSQTW